MIESRGDVDVFSFNAPAGQLEITVTPAWAAFPRTSSRGANLDIQAVLLDSTGMTIATSDPLTDTNAVISAAVAGGTYYLQISGVGNANVSYSDYASLGQYFIAGTLGGAAVPNAPPTANFGFVCAGLACSFTDASGDSDGTIAARSWDFGDGASSKAASPSHTFAAADTYAVSLRVTDDAGASDTLVKSVTVSSGTTPPPTALTVTVGGQAQALPVLSYGGSQDGAATTELLDGGATLRLVGNGWKQVRLASPYTVTAATVLEVSFRSGAQGEVHAIGLDKDDGLSAGWAFAFYGTQSWGIRDFHTYDPASGTVTYTIPVGQYYSGTFDRLIFAMDHDVGSPTGESVFSNVRLYEQSGNNPPSAAFRASCTELGCSFTDQSTDSDGTLVAWRWDFGDGASASTQNPTHTYAGAGSYTVGLTVTDNSGATASTTSDVNVTVPNSPPSAAFTESCADLSCSFTDASTDSDGTIVTRSWDFGDGRAPPSTVRQVPTLESRLRGERHLLRAAYGDR